MIDQPTLNKDMYSPSEVARLFGVSKRTVLRWIASGQKCSSALAKSHCQAETTIPAHTRRPIHNTPSQK